MHVHGCLLDASVTGCFADACRGCSECPTTTWFLRRRLLRLRRWLAKSAVWTGGAAGVVRASVDADLHGHRRSIPQPGFHAAAVQGCLHQRTLLILRLQWLLGALLVRATARVLGVAVRCSRSCECRWHAYMLLWRRAFPCGQIVSVSTSTPLSVPVGLAPFLHCSGWVSAWT